MAEWKDTDKEKLTITTDLTGCDLVDLAYLRAKDLPNERLANIVDWLVSERTNSETFFWLARINNEPVGYAYAEEESGAVE